MTNARMVLAFLLAGCGMPATIGDAASEVGADAVLPDSTTRPCVPACPSEQTCVDGACFTPVLQRLAFTLADPQRLAVGQMLPFRVSAVYSNSETRDVSINAMLSLSEQTSVRFGPIVNDRPSLLGVAGGEAVLTAFYAGTRGDGARAGNSQRCVARVRARREHEDPKSEGPCAAARARGLAADDAPHVERNTHDPVRRRAQARSPRPHPAEALATL